MSVAAPSSGSDEGSSSLTGRSALVTGGAGGIGTGVTRRLAEAGVLVTVADVDDGPGEELAREIDGRYVHLDVTDPEANVGAVEYAAAPLGGLDLVHLNAGVISGFGLDRDFDPPRYRQAMAVNVDGVFYGVHAALPALRGRPGAQIVATASLAGLTGVATEPIYSATKHAVVGLVRSLGATLLEQGIRINALCPGFADTPMVEPYRELLAQLSLPIIAVEAVVEAFMAIVVDDRSGECWYVQAGRPSEPFRFRNLPGPRPE